MAFQPLGLDDKANLALANVGAVRGSLATLTNRQVPPWLRAGHPYPDGTLPMAKAAFEAVPSSDLLEVIAVRSPLHAIDGWAYLGRAMNALISGDAHAARHLAYYAELRGALSILASSSIGIFNRRNVAFDATGNCHVLSERGTHDMCWASIHHWSELPGSLDRLVEPLSIAGVSLLDCLRIFFPGSTSMALGSYLMEEWGFDLRQGAQDSSERSWSSYQPSALGPLVTTPADDLNFIRLFWETLRPGNVLLERHLLRIMLKAEHLSVGEVDLSDRIASYSRLDERVQLIVSEDFLSYIEDPLDHPILSLASDRAIPATPYSMLARAALLLKLATGMAEANLTAAGASASQFDDWWRAFGIEHGLWAPPYEPEHSSELWEDVSIALEDAANAPPDNRHAWTNSLGSAAFRICDTERIALWGLFR